MDRCLLLELSCPARPVEPTERRHSNPRPSDYKSLALPDCATPACFHECTPAGSSDPGGQRSISPSNSGMRSTWTSAARAGFGGAAARPLPAIAAGERVAGDALVPPDEHMPVDAAPTEPEARCRGKRIGVVRIHGVAVGQVRIAWSHSRSGEEGGRPEGQASLGEGGRAEAEEQEGPEADQEGLNGPRPTPEP